MNRINELENILLRAKQAYYFSGNPFLTDAQYDALEDELKSLDPTNSILAMVGAPIPADNQHKPAQHVLPMGSQEKVHSFEELQNWARLRKAPQELYHLSYKGDGGSISARYKDGQLVQAISRGDGLIGEDITASAVNFKGMPVRLPNPLTCSIRAEAVLTLLDWEIADPELSTNPRNRANGILGRKEGTQAELITILAFDIECDSVHLLTESAKSKYLEELGFNLAPWKGMLSLEEALAFYKETEELRKAEKLPYWIDGMVVKIESLAHQEELGISSGKPKGQCAWKFEAEAGESKLLDVEDQVGHSGAITPVARIEAVKIGGTTITNVSLANYELVSTLKLCIGDDIEVIKAGDIIPQVVKVLKHNDGKKVVAPTNCPVCQSLLSRNQNVDGQDTVVLFCKNPDCEAQTVGKIRRWAKSRDILGLGDSIIETLTKSETVREVGDLFTLTPEKIANLYTNAEKKIRLGQKRAEGICQEIQTKGRNMSLPEFLGAFGTRSLGVRRATLMLTANPDLNDIERWFDGSFLDEDFAARAGVPKMGKIIYEGLKAREEVIRAALPHITFTAPEAKPAPAAGGKTFCITGSLPSGKKKKDYAGPLQAAGHVLVDEVAKGTDFLVVSDPNGAESSKTKKAKKLGIPLITEDAMLDWIKNAVPQTVPEKVEEPSTPAPEKEKPPVSKKEEAPTPSTQKLEQGSLL